MRLSRPVTEIIKVRCSYRAYDGRPLEPAARDALQAQLEAPQRGPFGNEVRLVLLGERRPSEQPRKLGTYGVISGAPCFLVGSVREGQHALEDFGHVFERVVLAATDLGLGTCWLGGTFKRDQFGMALGAGSDEIVPAVSPVGYPRGRRSLVDSVFRWAAASKKRKPWSDLFFDNDLSTPLTEEAAGSYATALEMVRLGPSASNRQPWRLVRAGDGFHLYLQRTPGYQGRFSVDLQRLDMGIATCHFELTARELGLAGRWRVEAPPVASPPAHTSYVATWTVEGQGAG